ncbi:MAG: tRNA (adenine(22)-N(1))-methyltransferase [Christensenellales bacterium]|jgi:tRNA (adenine22-N1)-methyltransferase
MRAPFWVDARLTAIAELCGTSEVFADIGCDHGRLGAYLLHTKGCVRAIFADISEHSLTKARRLVAKMGFLEQSQFVVCDGADALTEPPDAAAIAGMGGETIAGILLRGREMLRGARIVAQPNVDAPMLRKTMADMGYAIVEERVVRDGGRLYIVIAAEPGEAVYDNLQLTVGPILMKTRPDALYDYAQFRIRVVNKALAGMQIGGADQSQMQNEKRIWEEVAKWR